MALSVAFVAAAVLPFAGPVRAAEAATPDQQLADRYAPIVAVQQHATACGDGEPYSPAPVEAVLGRPEVLLRAGDGSILTTAPTADDLANASADAYLDLPGNALDPGCGYETWFGQTGAAATPTVYSRVATDPDEPGRLALQYWIFWVYNDWNDRHEGDWEMLQIAFDADTAEDALQQQPVEVAVAQHEGSERRAWAKVQKDGDRPIVYPGTGSHATYYSPDHWFGKSAASGFGCDDTRGPSTRIDPAVVMLPQAVDGAGDPFAWLSFQGRWGERQPSFNNGPTGPTTKDQWDHPIRWMEEEGRDGSVSLPAVGSRVTDFFCTASAAGSILFIKFLDQPWLVAVVVLAVVALLVVGVRRTLWSPDLPLPVEQRRRNGQILRGAARLMAQHPRRFLPIAGLLLVGGVLAAVAQVVVLLIPTFDDVTDIVGRSSGAAATLALLAGALITLPVAIYAHAATLRLVADLDAGLDTARDASGHGILRRTWRSPALGTSAVFLLLALVLVTAPLFFAIVLALWSVSSSAADRDGTGIVASFRRSRRLTKRHRFRVLALVLVIFVVGLGTGPFIGTVVLIVLDVSFGFVNLIAALFLAVLLPWVSVALRLLHGDLTAATTNPHTSAT